ncbi:MAG: hypothetical protein H7Y27_02835 [Gemmatimonadaceae bacterium]|nr:hypothetical protein [Chitinophagaceae bacterium]
MTGFTRILLVISAILFSLPFTACKKQNEQRVKAMPEVTISAARLQSDSISLRKDTVYVIASPLFRTAGQVLFIEAGTLVKVKNNIGISVSQGGRLISAGTETEPVVFTSDALMGSAGPTPANGQNLWGGISLSGAAGFNSGIISYTRIEFATANGSAALSLSNIDSLTTIHHVQVSYAHTASSFEFSGGNVNAKYLISFAASPSDFLLTNGYKGRLQHAFAYRHPFFAGNNANIAGVYLQGQTTFPSLSNFTVLGPDGQRTTTSKYNDTVKGFSGGRVAALLVTGNAKFHIRNSVFTGFPKGGFYIDSRESGLSLQNGESDFTFNIVHSLDSNRVFYIPSNLIPPFTARDFKGFMLQPQFGNQALMNTQSLAYKAPFEFDLNPDPTPSAGSIALSGADFSGPIFNHNFFTQTVHKGALGSGSWFGGWVNFRPLQTDYNN